MVLQIPREHLKVITQHAREESPVEACGILIGRRIKDVKVVEQVLKTRNVLNSSYRYAMDFEELYEIFVQTAEEGKEVLGFYHSHPHSQSCFSQLDKSLAHYPNCSYLIYSNTSEKIRSFLQDGEEEEIKILEE